MSILSTTTLVCVRDRIATFLTEHVIALGRKFYDDETVWANFCMVNRNFLLSSMSHEFCDIVVELVNYGCDIVIKPVMLLYLR
jgi:hypothetical protein